MTTPDILTDLSQRALRSADDHRRTTAELLTLKAIKDEHDRLLSQLASSEKRLREWLKVFNGRLTSKGDDIDLATFSWPGTTLQAGLIELVVRDWAITHKDRICAAMQEIYITPSKNQLLAFEAENKSVLKQLGRGGSLPAIDSVTASDGVVVVGS